MLDLWYKNAIVYGLSVASYVDSDEDGTGDFRGLTRRLDHLSRLGVNCIWLLPFYPSPRRDYGYDVSDYYGVHPSCGSLGDFVEFSRAARERGMRILVDLVVNHTSDQHPWFQAARANPRSRFRDYYVWSGHEPRDADKGVAFPGHQQSVWTYDDRVGAWYFHRFYHYQPDLNLMNPAVREEIDRIMGFWLELGVSGFRIDAAPFLIEEVHPDGKVERHFDILRGMREFVSWRRGDAVLLAEANVAADSISDYFGPSDGDRMHMLFAFIANQYLFLALARRRAEPLVRGLRLGPQPPPLGLWAQFLRHHDELDLSRLTEDERQEIYAAFAPDPDMRLFGRGIRRRLASMLGGDRRRIELAYSLLYSLPGTPVLYYGEEIGMGEDLSLPERWPLRTVMQWSSGHNAGFSDAPSDKLIHPAIDRGPFGAQCVNVADQQRDPDSLLNWLRRLHDVRSSCPEVGSGTFATIDTDRPSVFAHGYRLHDRCLLLLHNLDEHPVAVELAETAFRHGPLVDLFGNELYAPCKGTTAPIEIDGFGYRWLRTDPLPG